MDSQTILQQLTVKRFIAALVLWQSISVLLMALGVWPDWIAWVTLTALIVSIIAVPLYESVLLVIISIPFYTALPNPYLTGLPMWRLLFIVLFFVWLFRLLVSQRQYVRKLLTFRHWYEQSGISNGANLWDVIKMLIARVDSRLMPWDKVGMLFVALATVSLLMARFPVHGLKQIIFLINVYLLYVVVVHAVTDQEKVWGLIRYTAYSLGIIVALGYAQFIATFFTSTYYFWQYWATMVSKLYYGLPLANVLIYSNSWFSDTGGGQSLRMFSIMQDSHSFAIVCLLFIAYLIPFTLRASSTYRLVKVWIVIGFTGLALILAGTRGVWVGMLAPLVIAAGMFALNWFRAAVRPILISQLVIITVFALSPLIANGFNWIRAQNSEGSFLDRAKSIYDLEESSNAGRLIIWRDSIVFAVLHPFGVGYGNFVVSLVSDIPDGTSFEDVANEKNLRYNLPQKFVTAHSLYLNILVELGFAGLLAFLLFWWEYFESVCRFLRRHMTRIDRPILFVVATGLAMVWILAHGVFDVTLLNDRVLMYFFLALAASGLMMRKYTDVVS